MKKIMKSKFSMIIFTLITMDIILSILVSLFNKNVQPVNQSVQQIHIYSPFEINKMFTTTQLNPPSQTTAENLYPNVSISFPAAIPADEQKKVHLTISPDPGAYMGWSTTNDTAFLVFSSSLTPNQIYTVTAVTPLKTYSWTFTTPSLQTNVQPYLDDQWANNQRLLRITYPWYNSFPIEGDGFFIYFNLTQKKLYANIYPIKNASSQITNQEIANLKSEVTAIVSQQGVNLRQFPISWSITPVSE